MQPVNDDAPVTQRDFREFGSTLRTELKAHLEDTLAATMHAFAKTTLAEFARSRADTAAEFARLRADTAAGFAAVAAEFARSRAETTSQINASFEQFHSDIRLLVDQGIANSERLVRNEAAIAGVRDDLEMHRGDPDVHRRRE